MEGFLWLSYTSIPLMKISIISIYQKIKQQGEQSSKAYPSLIL